ncbi:MAG: hypothetical protein GY880_22110 [Planctomycetaceae bacterium]|nr:hypothetical protein [Planctomycetaceae bacterium]
MPQKRHAVDQIVARLRKADIELGKGKSDGTTSKIPLPMNDYPLFCTKLPE